MRFWLRYEHRLWPGSHVNVAFFHMRSDTCHDLLLHCDRLCVCVLSVHIFPSWCWRDAAHNVISNFHRYIYLGCCRRLRRRRRRCSKIIILYSSLWLSRSSIPRLLFSTYNHPLGHRCFFFTLSRSLPFHFVHGGQNRETWSEPNLCVKACYD